LTLWESPLSSETAQNVKPRPDEAWSERTAFVHYLKEAMRIVSWDEMRSGAFRMIRAL